MIYGALWDPIASRQIESLSVLRRQPQNAHVQHDGIVGDEQVDPGFAAGGGGKN